MRAALESLLRARKLDTTLTTPGAAAPLAPDRSAPTAIAALDAALGGGLRRGHLSEIVGAPSTGRTTLAVAALAAATARGEAVALIDSADTFDPASAAAHGVSLPQLLWVRPAVDPLRAVKAFSLVLQAGGFGLAILDLADAAPPLLRQLPATTWMRLARIIEGSDTVALLIGAERLARSAGGVTIALESAAAAWQGAAHRARLFTGIATAPRVVGGRSTKGGGQRTEDPSAAAGSSGANWRMEDAGRPSDANARQRVSHVSGAGLGAPASERVGGSGAQPLNWS